MHPERARLGGDERADAAEADEPERASGELDPGHRRPLAGARVLAPAHERAGEREQERDRQLGDGVRVRAGRRRDGDAVAGRRGEVDAVEAGAVAGDDTQARRPLEDLGADLVEAGDQPVRVLDLGGERGGVERAGPVAHLADRALERAPQHRVVHPERARRHDDDALREGRALALRRNGVAAGVMRPPPARRPAPPRRGGRDGGSRPSRSSRSRGRPARGTPRRRRAARRRC